MKTRIIKKSEEVVTYLGSFLKRLHLRILLIEDDPEYRSGLLKNLQLTFSDETVIEVAESKEEVEDYVRRWGSFGGFDLVVLDYEILDRPNGRKIEAKENRYVYSILRDRMRNNGFLVYLTGFREDAEEIVSSGELEAARVYLKTEILSKKEEGVFSDAEVSTAYLNYALHRACEDMSYGLATARFKQARGMEVALRSRDGKLEAEKDFSKLQEDITFWWPAIEMWEELASDEYPEISSIREEVISEFQPHEVDGAWKLELRPEKQQLPEKL